MVVFPFLKRSRDYEFRMIHYKPIPLITKFTFIFNESDKFLH